MKGTEGVGPRSWDHLEWQPFFFVSFGEFIRLPTFLILSLALVALTQVQLKQVFNSKKSPFP